MTKLVDTVKEIGKAKIKSLKKPGNITSLIKSEKDIIKKAQKFSPASKYLGISGVPGVKSGKEEKDDAKKADDEAAAAAAKEAAEAAKPKPMPIYGDVELAKKKEAARRRRSGGRLSTILSDEGLG